MDIYNNKKTYFYKLKSSCNKEWSEYTDHNFLSDLVSNKLPDKNFKKYLVQDYIFSCFSPCIIGYGEIGFKLSKNKNWKKSKYSSWIKMYSS